jgi:hypothetical protein
LFGRVVCAIMGHGSKAPYARGSDDDLHRTPRCSVSLSGAFAYSLTTHSRMSTAVLFARRSIKLPN